LFVTAIKIDDIDGYIIHGFPRGGTGSHGNDYIKIKKGGDRGKYRLGEDIWETNCSLDAAAKKKITAYILDNKANLRQKIKDLG
jgi:hypothetical protein